MRLPRCASSLFLLLLGAAGASSSSGGGGARRRRRARRPDDEARRHCHRHRRLEEPCHAPDPFFPSDLAGRSVGFAGCNVEQSWQLEVEIHVRAS